MFDYYKSNPREGASFNQVMGGVMAHQASWLDIFPHERLLQTADPTTPLLVDVGGNVGHDMGRFYEAHPETAARLYLEDRPEVVKLSKVPDPVNKIGYDFFTPQPVKGKIFFLPNPDAPVPRLAQVLSWPLLVLGFTGQCGERFVSIVENDIALCTALLKRHNTQTRIISQIFLPHGLSLAGDR